MPESSRAERSRNPQRPWPWSCFRSRKRLESPALSTAHLHREDAKKGGISDLAYDNIQEEMLRIHCRLGERSVEYALECEPDDDLEQALINAALTNRHWIWTDETSSMGHLS